jgi:hypothetical protein
MAFLVRLPRGPHNATLDVAAIESAAPTLGSILAGGRCDRDPRP